MKQTALAYGLCVIDHLLTDGDGLHVVFCMVDGSFSDAFLDSWTRLLCECAKCGVRVSLGHAPRGVVSWSRAEVLGAKSVGYTPGEQVFNGAFDYDAIMWVSRDKVFEPDDFFRLLESPHAVTCGGYVNGSLDESGAAVSLASIAAWQAETDTRYMPLDVGGMSWTLIRKGVFEQLNAPWFRDDKFYKDGDHQCCVSADLASPYYMGGLIGEDAMFSANLRSVGVVPMLDTAVWVRTQVVTAV